MKKRDFLEELANRLAGLPQEDIQRSLDYYAEMIEDRIEDGISEENAVRAVGTPAEAASQILSEIPLPKLVKARIKPSHALRIWEIILLILGSPIWLSLLIAAIAVVFATYTVIWSALIVLCAVEITFGACSVFGIFAPVFYAVQGNIGTGVAIFGMGLILAGLTVLMFLVCRQATKTLCQVSKRIFLGIKSCFIRKGTIK